MPKTTGVKKMTDPLTPPGCDLRHLSTMPFSVSALRDSRIIGAISGDAFKAAVLLWCAAWHQVPAASLPDDDRELAKLAGFGIFNVTAFTNMREDVLYGFVKCSDGRLYHPVIAEHAKKMAAKYPAPVQKDLLGMESLDKPSRKKTATHWDPSRTPNIPQEWLNEALKLGLNPETATIQFDRFSDFWRAKGDANARKSDWTATFRNSCRNYIERSAPKSSRSEERRGKMLRGAASAAYKRGDPLAHSGR